MKNTKIYKMELMSMDTDTGLDGPQLVPPIFLNKIQHIYHHSVTKAKFI